MKRCPELQNLSREHHTALRLAVHWRRAAQSGDDQAIVEASAHAREAFDAELLPHFREEEIYLLPRLEAVGASAVVARTLIEHRAMQRLVRELEIPDGDVIGFNPDADRARGFFVGESGITVVPKSAGTKEINS